MTWVMEVDSKLKVNNSLTKIMQGKFLNAVDNKDRVFLYVEQNEHRSNDDENFYYPYVKTILYNYNIKFIPKSGQKYVLEELSKGEMLSEKVNYNNLFFIDRDYLELNEPLLFDELTRKETLFITEYHSFENYYVSKENYENLLMRFYGIRTNFNTNTENEIERNLEIMRKEKEEQLLSNLIESYNKAYEKFLNTIGTIIGALIYSSKGEDCKIDKFYSSQLSEINYEFSIPKPNEKKSNEYCFEFINLKIKEKYEVIKMFQMGKKQDNLIKEEQWKRICESAEIYNQKDVKGRKILVRGKQDFAFFHSICLFTETILKKYINGFSKSKPSFFFLNLNETFKNESKEDQIENENKEIVSVEHLKRIMSGFIKPPSKLIEFLINAKNKLENSKITHGAANG